jgi:cell division protein FtsL
MTEKKSTSRQSKKEKRRAKVWLTEAQAVLSWGVILALGALLGTIYLYQASRIATVGRRVQELQNELDEIKRVNAELERGIAEGQSLERLQAEAASLGFVAARAEDIEYLVVPDYPTAINMTATAVPPPTLPPPIETMREAMLIAFRNSVNDLVRGESP